VSPSRAILEGFKTVTSVGGYKMTTCKSVKFRAQFDYQHARIHLYSRHVALSGSGTWDYVSLRWLMTLPIYKKTTDHANSFRLYQQAPRYLPTNIPAAPVFCMLSLSPANTHILKFHYDGMHTFIIRQDIISF
jgi:hypothetical protein